MTNRSALSTAPTQERLLYDRKTAATMLSISVRMVDYMITTQTIKVRRIGSRVLIPVDELHRVACQDHPAVLASR